MPRPTDPDSRVDARPDTAPPPNLAPASLLPAAPRMPALSGAVAPRRRWRAVRLVLTLLLISAAAGGGAWWTLLRPLPVGVVHPWHGEAIEAVYATGVVEAIDTARVSTTVAARIDTLLVEEGDRVRQGQVLARLDDRQAQQRLSDAKARLALAEQELARDQALLQRGIRTQQAEQRSREERDRAAAFVALATKQLSEYTILSPLDGIVMTRPVKVGETLPENGVLFTIASPAHLRVAAEVDERDIPQVQMGAEVAIRADAFPNEVFTARVTKIRTQGDTASRTYRVEANLPPDTKLMIGMTVDVNIVVAERADALLVPSSAVRHAPAKGGMPGAAYVFRVEDGVARRTPITLGAEGPETAEVRAGLAPDATVVADPPEGLAEGARVRSLAGARS